MKTGHIRIIDNKIHFEYYESDKPNALKQLVEVSNVRKSPYNKNWFYKYFSRFEVLAGKMAINNQSCKANVTEETAIIVKLIKYNELLLSQ